ncbi:MAG: hydrogenase iron-sulfur subunit, partial [Thermoplasmata archaeon]
MKKFEPVIIGFVCNECVYAAADLAGTTRLPYPSNIRLIRIPCSGQVDTIHILRAFEKGADGVFIGGCLKEQCHYVDGNKKAEKRVNFLKGILNAMGMEEERLSIHFMSAAMAREFASLANDLTSTIKKLGPSPLKRKKTPLRHDKKRTMLREMLLGISQELKTKAVEFSEVISGYGETIFDKEKCLGCGACGYVCKDGAITVESKGDNIQIKNTYWKCTACGKCEELCPKECLDVREEFDLMRFLSGEEEVKVEVGMIRCERCGKSFLPIMLTNEIEKMLTDRSLSSSFVGLCPTCRKFSQAEKVRTAQGFIGRGMRETVLR